MTANKVNNKRVFILGAGSSISHSGGVFPCIKQFFNEDKMFDKNTGRGYNYGYNTVKKKYEEKEARENFNLLKGYIKDYTGVDVPVKPYVLDDTGLVDNGNGVDIEEIMTYVDIDLERMSQYTYYHRLKEELHFLIRRVLFALNERVCATNSDYNDFKKVLDSKDTILAFNWDILLDEVFGRKLYLDHKGCRNVVVEGKTTPQYWNFYHSFSGMGYGIVDSLSVEPPYDSWRPPTREEGVYLKLHGSIDWFYCANEGCRLFNLIFPVKEPTGSYYCCSECHEHNLPLIIPPVLNKVYRQHPVIRRIWNHAADEVKSANELIIWGYSLPPTDFYSKWLLLQARGTHNSPSNLSRVTIINPSVVDREGSHTDFMDRFKRLFQGVEKFGGGEVKFKPYSSYQKYHSAPCPTNE